MIPSPDSVIQWILAAVMLAPPFVFYWLGLGSLVAGRDRFVGISSILIALICGIVAFLLGFTDHLSVVVGLSIYGFGVILFLLIPPIASLIRRLRHVGTREVESDLKGKLKKLDARAWILSALYGVLLLFGWGMPLPVAALFIVGLLLFAGYWYFLYKPE
jgi:hypothetical protein